MDPTLTYVFDDDTQPSTSNSTNLTSKMIKNLRSSNEENYTNSESANETSSNNVDPFLPRVNMHKWKNRMASVWHNVKYGWNTKSMSSFYPDSPIILLGRLYDVRLSSDTAKTNDVIDALAIDDYDTNFSFMRDFYLDLVSRFWFTYRINFPRICTSTVTSDAGWGCMLRSTQMFFAQALLLHWIGRDFSPFVPNNFPNRHMHRAILSLFADNHNAPLSIHSLVMRRFQNTNDMTDKNVENENNYVKQWYGPSAAAYLLRDIVNPISLGVNTSIKPAYNTLLSEIAIYVASDNTICIQDVDELMSGSDSNGQWKCACVIIIPLRLGSNRPNELYAPHIKTLLSLESCLGIIGGKPKHSLYFIGWHRQSLLYLDPHFCQNIVEMDDIDEIAIESYHCHWARLLPFSQMDPSAAIGFYCRTRSEFNELLVNVNEVVEVEQDVVMRSRRIPLFSIIKQRVELRIKEGSNEHSPTAKNYGFEVL